MYFVKLLNGLIFIPVDCFLLSLIKLKTETYAMLLVCLVYVYRWVCVISLGICEVISISNYLVRWHRPVALPQLPPFCFFFSFSFALALFFCNAITFSLILAFLYFVFFFISIIIFYFCLHLKKKLYLLLSWSNFIIGFY